MARIAGIDLPKNKRIEIALTYIVGVGKTTAKKVLTEAKVNSNLRTEALTEEQVGEIRKVLESNHPVEGDVRRQVSQSIKRLMDLGTFRGLRHRKGLPVRGQRTRTNSRTRKGPRKAAIAGKKTPGKK
ncbi:MAG: 30S ribosomal protein S13 [Deltaproteobacteria bacterium]|jgi:small subunit ribosomal protein S13|nr:30S ribosomal protein S13 [Deltaproteobacteria bacterium]